MVCNNKAASKSRKWCELSGAGGEKKKKKHHKTTTTQKIFSMFDQDGQKPSPDVNAMEIPALLPFSEDLRAPPASV